MQSFTTYDVLSSAFITFLFKFAVTESAQNWLSFFVVLQHLLMHPPIPYRFCLCVCWYHFLLHVQHWNCFHTQHMKQNLHFSGICKWIWIYYTTNHWLSHNIVYLWRSWIWIIRFWFFCSRHQFYLVIIRRSSLTENKIGRRIGGKNRAEKLKIIRHLKV